MRKLKMMSKSMSTIYSKSFFHVQNVQCRSRRIKGNYFCSLNGISNIPIALSRSLKEWRIEGRTVRVFNHTTFHEINFFNPLIGLPIAAEILGLNSKCLRYRNLKKASEEKK